MTDPVQYTDIFDLTSLTGENLIQVQSVLSQIESTVVGQELLSRVQNGAEIISVTNDTSIQNGYSHSAGILNLNWDHLSTTQMKFSGGEYDVVSINRTIVHEVFHAAEAGFNPDYANHTALELANAHGSASEFFLRSNIEMDAVKFTNLYMEKYYGKPARLSEYTNKVTDESPGWHPLKKGEPPEDVSFYETLAFDDASNQNPEYQEAAWYSDNIILDSFYDVQPKPWYEIIRDYFAGEADVGTFKMFDTYSLDEAKILGLDARLLDAEVNGIVISDVIGTATLYGTTFNTYERSIERGDGTTMVVTEFTLPSESAAPANGVFYQRFVIELDDVSTVLNAQENTSFLDNQGNTHYTVEQKDGIDGNWNVRETILSTDGQFYVGNTFTVPSGELLSTLQSLGHTVGSLLADHLADGNAYKALVYKALIPTITEHFGTFTAFLAAGNDLGALVKATLGVEIQGTALDTPEFSETFYKNLNGAFSSIVGNLIVDEVGEALGINGTIGGEVFNVVGTTVTTGIVNASFGLVFDGIDGGAYTSLLTSGFDFNAPFNNPSLPPATVPDGFIGPPPPNSTVGDFVQFQVANALGAYAGGRLAGELIEPESEIAALFGAVGSAVATGIATGAFAAGNAIAAVFQGIGWAGGPIGAAVGAFVGTIVGTALGNAFGDEENPSAWAQINYSNDLDAYKIGSNWGHDGGDAQIAYNMAKSVIDGVNGIIDMTDGALRSTALSTAPRLQIGWKEGTFVVSTSNDDVREFSNSGKAIEYAAFKLLKGFDLVGGHAVVMRAWHNSDATNLREFKEDIDIAEAFQNYLLDPTSILVLMMNDPDSALAQSWATILQRAAELELHLPHEKDLDGGWNELLLARGDIDPALIPDIQGDTIILTDPVTGEETVLHHVIGPGYEIVRIEGTDGNDIIEVIVDGASVSYIDGGAGDDTIIGSEQNDIIVGGAGDDIIDGKGGDDWINGGEGNDTLDGGAGDDLVVGGDDLDTIFGGDGTDNLYGSNGDDLLDGRGGQDYLYGGNGNDVLHGETTNDDDAIDRNNDKLFGEGGEDTLYGHVYDSLDGGLGNDTFVLAGWDNVVLIERGDGHDTIVIDEQYSNTIRFGISISPNELFFTQTGDDLAIKVLGDDQSVTIQNWFGSHSVTPQITLQAHGTDFQVKLPHYDIVNPYNALSEQPSGVDNTLSDAALMPLLFQSVWELSSQTTLASIENVADYTTIPSILSVGEKSAWAGTGNSDTILMPNYSSTSGRIFGGAGDDNLTGRDDQVDYIHGDSGDDIIRGAGGRDILSGGLGNDFVSGQSGSDTLYGGQGDDLILGGTGNDVIYGGAGNDTIEGHDGNDKIMGGLGNDIILDTEGFNTILGGDGDDHITVQGIGSNTLYGDLGNDTMYGGRGWDSLFGGDGIDLLLGNEGNDLLSGDLGDDTLNGGSGEDDLIGGDGDDLLFGGLNTDYLSGGRGNDQLFGESGSDVLYGEEGTDILEGGRGNDYLFGGLGDDTYVFNATKTYLTLNDVNNDGRVQLSSVNPMPTTAMTMAISFRTEATNNSGLVSYAVSGNSNEIILYKPSDFSVYIDNLAFNTNLNFADGQWHDLVVTWERSDGLVQVFDNGSLVYSHAHYTGTVLNANGTLMIGQEQDSVGGGLNSAQAFHGDVDNFAVWDYVLDTTEIVAGVDINNAVIAYDFNEGNGTAINDLSGSQNALLVGDIDWVAGVDAALLGQSSSQYTNDPDVYITLDGTDGRIQIDGVNPMATTEITMEVAFRTEAVNNAGLLSYAVSGNSNELVLYKPHSLEIVIDNYYFQTGLSFNDGQWHNLVVTWERTAGTVNLYDNGQLVYTAAHYTGTVLNANGTLMLGQEQDSVGGGLNPAQAFNGDIAGFSMWDHVLDAAEVAAGTNKSDALYDYKFNEGAGTVLINQSGNANANLVGNYIWKDSATNGAPDDETLGTDIIYDIDGNNTILFGEGVSVNDITFERSDSDIFDLNVVLLGNVVATIDDQFIYGSITSISFNDGSVINLADNTYDINGTNLSDIYYGTEIGGSIDDIMYGYDGDDKLYGDDGNDTLNGGLGLDSLYGGIGNDLLYGEDGDDKLLGNEGNDILNGQDGNDMLFGGDGSDYLYGGAGDDIIAGGSGIDMLYGQTGADTFIFEAISAFTDTDNIQDFKISDGDKLDISDLLVGYDPLTDIISDYVQITDNGSHSYLAVDANGGADNFVQVAYIYNETGLTDEDALETSGNLIAA